jgi:hypothetical protein
MRRSQPAAPRLVSGWMGRVVIEVYVDDVVYYFILYMYS